MVNVVDPGTNLRLYQHAIQKYWNWLLSDDVNDPQHYPDLYLMRTCYDFRYVFSVAAGGNRLNRGCQGPNRRTDDVSVGRKILIPYIDACFEDYYFDEFGSQLDHVRMTILANEDLRRTVFAGPIIVQPRGGQPMIVGVPELQSDRFLIDSGNALFDLTTMPNAPLIDRMEDPQEAGLHHAYAKGHYVLIEFDQKEVGTIYNIRSSAQGARDFNSSMDYTITLI